MIDAQVVGEQVDLDRAHRRKIEYYSEDQVVEAIKREHEVQSVIVTSATLSWKGVWSPLSALRLRELGVIRAGDTKVLSTRVLIGSL